jgi:hypothetical protein
MTDRATRYMLERAAAAIAQDQDGRLYFDELAPAVYRLEPPGAECVVVACVACQVATVRPGSPTQELVTIRCQQCATPIVLRPPAEVLAFGRSGITIAAPRSPRLS